MTSWSQAIALPLCSRAEHLQVCDAFQILGDPVQRKVRELPRASRRQAKLSNLRIMTNAYGVRR